MSGFLRKKGHHIAEWILLAFDFLIHSFFVVLLYCIFSTESSISMVLFPLLPVYIYYSRYWLCLWKCVPMFINVCGILQEWKQVRRNVHLNVAAVNGQKRNCHGHSSEKSCEKSELNGMHVKAENRNIQKHNSKNCRSK